MVVYVKTNSRAGHAVELHIAPQHPGGMLHNYKFTKKWADGKVQYIVGILLSEGHVCAYMQEFFSVSFVPAAIKEGIIEAKVKDLYNDLH